MQADKEQKITTKKTLHYLTNFIVFALLVCSAIYATSSISKIISTQNIHEFDFSKAYLVLCEYSGLYKFTFIVLAFSITLRQLRLSQENNERAINQLKFTQDDIENKTQKEIKNETLKQCAYFLNDIQLSFKELIGTNDFSGMPVTWDKLETVTSESLSKYYPAVKKQIDTMNQKHKSDALIVLYKLEAFSSLFNHGFVDIVLAKEIIGKTFYMQVGFLLGVIAYYRPEKNLTFMKNTLELHKKWTDTYN